MSTVQFDTAMLASYRKALKTFVEGHPDYQVWKREMTKLVHMNDRQLHATLMVHTFLSMIEWEMRDNLRRHRMRPVPSTPGDSEDAEAV